MMNGKAVRGIGTMVLCWLAALTIVMATASPPANALNFAVYPLEELAAEADRVFIGTVVKREGGDRDSTHWYTFRVDIPLAGGFVAEQQVKTRVTQFADEGVLHKGDTYLMLLDDYGADGYAISGTHQGFVKLKNGTAESRFYGQEVVDRYLEQYGLKVKTIYERLLPVKETPAKREGHSRDTETAIVWAAGIALAAMLIGLYLRSRRANK